MSQITPGKKRYVKRRLTDESPTVWIGKGGASENLLGEISKQLEKNKMVKVKILKNVLTSDQTKQVASETAARTESTLVEVRGHTFMLYKRSKK